MLPDDHELYSSHGRSFLNLTFSDFIFQLGHYILCEGITIPELSKEITFQKHVIPKKFNYLDFQKNSFQPRLHQDEFYRSNSCRMLISDSHNPCSSCRSHNTKCTVEMYS